MIRIIRTGTGMMALRRWGLGLIGLGMLMLLQRRKCWEKMVFKLPVRLYGKEKEKKELMWRIQIRVSALGKFTIRTIVTTSTYMIRKLTRSLMRQGR